MFTWTPIYKELARTLLAYRNRQSELIRILADIRETTSFPVIRLIDAPKPATEPRLSEIDPFTFFATFNRGLTDENRIGILKILKEKFQMQAGIPTDFSGIPVVDNMKSWFFPFAFNRQADDITSLWDLAESIISNPPERLNPELFNRCLEVQMVGPAKLTMGLFWMNPDNYLALDEKNTKVFERAGIDIEVVDYTTYLNLLAKVREKLGTNYPAISIGAWQNAQNKNGGDPKPENRVMAEPFSSIFQDRSEAEWAFDFLQETLGRLGVKSPEDARVALTLPKGENMLRLNFGQWVIASIYGEAGTPERAELSLLQGLADLTKKGTFSTKANEPETCVYGVPIAKLRTMELSLRSALDKSLAFIATRFQHNEGTSFRNSHQPRLMEMVFDKEKRARYLNEGLSQPLETSYWKIAPGDDAWQWDECSQNGFIAVGWDDFGDLSGVDHVEFDRRFENLLPNNPGRTKVGCEQLWRFSQIRIGDRIVANRGTTEVLV